MALADNTVLTPDIGNVDDGFVTITLPWTIRYLQQNFTKLYVSTNSFVLFTNEAAPPSPTVSINVGNSVNLPYVTVNYPNLTTFPGASMRLLRICSNDHTMQRIMHGLDTDTIGTRSYRIRYEGSNTKGFVPSTAAYPAVGTSNIAWEITLLEAEPTVIDLYVDNIPEQLNKDYLSGSGFTVATSAGLTVNTTGTFDQTVTKTNTRFKLTSNDGVGSNTYMDVYLATVSGRGTLFYISGIAGTLLLGDPQLPVNLGSGDVCYSPDSWGSQVTFHSRRKYLKINGIITTTAGTWAAVPVDYRTWTDPSSKGC